MPKMYRYQIDELYKFLDEIDFSESELRKHYDLTPDLIKRTQEFEGNEVLINDKEKQNIEKILRTGASSNRVPITNKFKRKLKILKRDIGGKILAEHIDEPQSTVTNLLRGNTKTTTCNMRKKINKAYYDYKRGTLRTPLTDFKSGLTLKQLQEEDLKKALEKNKKHFKPLEIGKTYKIYEKMPQRQTNPYELVFEGTVLEEYKNYYFGKNGDRKVTFMKNLLYLPNYKVEEIKNE